jgi:hypothetical protein
MSAAAAIKREDRTRQSLRLDSGVWTAIDAARLRRPGNVSRNTWITEAIIEKLAHEQDQPEPPPQPGRHRV